MSLSRSRQTAERVLRLEAEGILGLIGKLDDSFDRAVQMLQRGAGRVIVTGMGKSGIIGRKIAATISCTLQRVCTEIWAWFRAGMLSLPSPTPGRRRRCSPSCHR